MELQFITHFTDQYSYYDSARMALEGGCRWIQLRMKDATPDEIRPEAVRIQALCREYGATFIIDDHVELVKELHADGVHLGKKDMPIAEARQILGKDYYRRNGQHLRGCTDALSGRSRLYRLRSVPLYYDQEEFKSDSWTGRV